MTETIQVQIPVKSSACDFFKGSIDVNIYPKALPNFYDRVEVLQGDGIAEGSIYILHMGKDSPETSIVTVKVVEIDTANMKATYDFIDGDLTKHYKKYKVFVQMIPKEDGEGCLVNWLCEYEKKSPEVPAPTFHRDAMFNILDKIDAYLLKA